jgi:hypothetical protein
MFVIVFTTLSVILLIYLLFATYSKIKKQLNSKVREKYEQLCPDYWEMVGQRFDDSGNVVSIECKNVHKLGRCAVDGSNTFKFEDEIFINPDTADISRCKWAKRCGTTWQGYDNLCV